MKLLSVFGREWTQRIGQFFDRTGSSSRAGTQSEADKALDQRALDYHRYPQPGKIRIEASKPLNNPSELALAYSPGVAAPCREIARRPDSAGDYTARSNLVAVVTNGTAVLGLGAIGPLAAKPVMEGKAALFKKFAGINVFDIEIDEKDPEKLAEIIVRLEPTFGGINLEDIKSPDCFKVEKLCTEKMSIPVFHDDQHGTAICVLAAIQNGLAIAGKKLGNASIVCSGAGAAAIACLDLLVAAGADRKKIIVCDRNGVLYKGRKKGMNDLKRSYAARTRHRSLEQAMQNADIFLGVSSAGLVEPDWLLDMADDPLVLALANPDPEIMPHIAKAVRPDAIVATGRSDFPNQVNNVLCFPYIFRGALDCRASRITQDMKIAAATALADLAREPVPDSVTSIYGVSNLEFGPDYILPKPFDPRLRADISSAVADAARKSRVAAKPIANLADYRDRLRSS